MLPAVTLTAVILTGTGPKRYQCIFATESHPARTSKPDALPIWRAMERRRIPDRAVSRQRRQTTSCNPGRRNHAAVSTPLPGAHGPRILPSGLAAIPVALRIRVLVAMLLLPGLAARAQENRLLPASDWAYDYIVRLQQRGHLLELNPTAVPYRHGDVWAALEQVDRSSLAAPERHWVRLLERAVAPEEGTAVGYTFEAAARLVNSDRLDLVRPLGDSLRFFWYGTPATVYLDTESFVAEFGLRQDRYYDDDPDGLDTALRLLARSDHTYVGYHSRLVSVYGGRWNQHWGVPGEEGTLLSDNPRSQDQLAFRLGKGRLAIRAVLGELDSITSQGDFTGRAGDDTVRVETRRRYLAAHRWDYRPSRRLLISFMESVLYSGANAGLSLKYLTPVHPFAFVVDNSPKNEENNGFVAGLLWAQLGRLTVHGQLTVDDIRLQRGTGNESVTFGFTGSMAYALRMVDLKATLTAITARTYNAPQPEGKYLYLKRGLATQFSDYVAGSAGVDIYLDHVLPGLRLAPRMDVLWQGARDIRQPFPSNDAVLDNILDGTVQRTVRGSLRVAYQPVAWWWLRMDGGVNSIRNADNVRSAEYSRFVGLVSSGLRLKIDYPVRL